jgi:hypothetical protein
MSALVIGLAAPAFAVDHGSGVKVEVDSGRREVVLTVGPLHVPESTPYSHHPSETHLRFAWPVAGWMRGYRLDLFDSAGRPLSREMLHHAGVANPGRRQLPYPLVERLFGVGRETRPVMLPASMGVPMATGQELLLYYALVNATTKPVDDALLRVTIAWTPEDDGRPRDVFPLYLDANPSPVGGTRAYDVPPGVSVTSAEFTLPIAGRLRAVGAHLHDHAVEIRLEDVETGERLVRLAARRGREGRLVSVDSTRFPFKRGGLRLAANRRYRVVGVYDNPTGAPLPAGAMAFLAGPFVPDDPRRWPALDEADPIFAADLRGMVGEGEPAGHGHHGHGATLPQRPCDSPAASPASACSRSEAAASRP